jgi:hypothetical protein
MNKESLSKSPKLRKLRHHFNNNKSDTVNNNKESNVETKEDVYQYPFLYYVGWLLGIWYLGLKFMIISVFGYKSLLTGSSFTVLQFLFGCSLLLYGFRSTLFYTFICLLVQLILHKEWITNIVKLCYDSIKNFIDLIDMRDNDRSINNRLTKEDEEIFNRYKDQIERVRQLWLYLKQLFEWVKDKLMNNILVRRYNDTKPRFIKYNETYNITGKLQLWTKNIDLTVCYIIERISTSLSSLPKIGYYLELVINRLKEIHHYHY